MLEINQQGDESNPRKQGVAEHQSVKIQSDNNI